MGDVKTAIEPHVRDRILIHVRENGRASAAMLKSILEHINDASEGDRGLDAMTAEAAGLVPQGYWRDLYSFGAQYAPRGRLGTVWVAPPLTASINAAVEMVSRALPDAYLEIGVGAHKEGRRISTAFVRLGDHDIGECWEAATAPLAICAALLSALIAQAEQGASQ